MFHQLSNKRFAALFVPVTWVVMLAPSALAEVTLPNIFSDHMVLQQKQANRVWGRATPGEKVTVSIGDQSHQTMADQDGTWQVELVPMEVGEPLELVVQGKDSQIRVKDVLVGEVWICSGQSNMEFSMRGDSEFDLERITADLPEIRSINFPNIGTQEPIWTHKDSNWTVCAPETLQSFSAVGYYFGRQIHEAVGVPVGLINNSWGGSRAESWVRRSEFEGNEMLQPIVDRYDQFEIDLHNLEAKKQLNTDEQQRLRQRREDIHGNDRPANLYNGILVSHLGYGIRGVIWYQGEGNTPRAYQYRELFPLVIKSWREEWGQGDFPFYWVQLADYKAETDLPVESDWAELREAQTMTMNRVPNTGEAVIIDLGEGKDIHPRSKRTVGLRLARWALARDYGFEIAHHSPTYQSMHIEDGKITLSFDHINGRWRTFDVETAIGFAIAGNDRQFVWADATINADNTITVSSPEVPSPVAVRYAWADNPACNVYDTSGLPLTPFRTDEWPGMTATAR